MIAKSTLSIEDEPQTYNEAWNHPNPKVQRKWQEAIWKEFKDMIWRKMLKSLMPPNCSCVKNKWVFKIKDNGVYWACLVACGYSQVLRLHFSKNYSPRVNDIMFFILLLMIFHFGLLAKVVDVKTAFLYGDLEEEVYMECPQGMSNSSKDDCIILNKCIYGLVQAARWYYKRIVKILKK